MQNEKQRFMSAEDKELAKGAAKSACAKMRYCGERFSEIIFIVSLLGASVLEILWAFVFTDAKKNSAEGKFESLVETVHYLILAALLFAAWRDN